MNRIIRLLLLVVFSISVLSLHAQNADKMYSEGLELLNQARTEKKSKSVRNLKCDEAIKKFKAAAIMNTTFKKKCNTQINVAQKLRRSPWKSDPDPGPDPNPDPPVKDKLELSKSQLNFGYQETNSEKITVDTNGKTWDAELEYKSDAEWCTFGTLEKYLTVRCAPNKSTEGRTAIISVTSGSLKKKVKVVQAGIPVELYVTKVSKKFFVSESEKIEYVELKKKGGDINLVVACNSMRQYDENDKYNWKVEYLPDWCKIIPDYVANQKNEANEFKNNSSEKVRNIKLVAKPIEDKKSDEYKLGRKGEIAFRSQDTIVKITIYQNK